MVLYAEHHCRPMDLIWLGWCVPFTFASLQSTLLYQRCHLLCLNDGVLFLMEASKFHDVLSNFANGRYSVQKVFSCANECKAVPHFLFYKVHYIRFYAEIFEKLGVEFCAG